MLLPVLLLIAVGFAVACPGTLLARRLGLRWGQLDHPGERKIHAQPIPATGGMAIAAAVLGPMAVGLMLCWTLPVSFFESWLPDVAPHLEGIRRQTPLAVAALLGASALHVVGLIDDRKNLGPAVKLVAQAGAALLVIGFGARMLELWGTAWSVAITLLWFLAITNAFNFLDNMDGLTGGVGVICGAIFLAIALLTGQWFVAALLALLVGALLGFLVFNFPPASIFMGDGGSLVVGFLLALCSVRVTYYGPNAEGWWAVFTPLVVLAIPLYDLSSVTLIRLAQGKSPCVGDTQHFSHRLVKRGLSRRGAVAVIWGCTLAAGLGGVMMPRLADWQAIMVALQTLAVLGVLALLERGGHHGASS